MVNNLGETALHMVCKKSRLYESDNAVPSTLAVEIGLWLVENGCPVDSKDGDGNTALHLAVMVGNVTLASALVRRGADMNAKNDQNQTPLDLLHSSADIEKICMIGRIGSSDKKKFLGAPNKINSCTYLSLLLEKISLTNAAELECPFISISVFDAAGNTLEESQDMTRYMHRNENRVWFVTSWHMQTPLENLGTGCFIILEIKDEKTVKNKVVANSVCWTVFRLSDDKLNTASHNLECFEGVVNLKLEKMVPAACGAFVNVDSHLTKKG